MMDNSVAIRMLQPEDAEALLALRERVRDFVRPWEPVPAEGHFTLEGQRLLIGNALRSREAGTAYGFGIFAGREGRLAGRVNLSNVSRGAWQSCTIGYFTDPALGGRGLATEAVRLACRFAFGEAGLHRVQGAVMPRNKASIRVLEKAGFQYEGLARYYLCINGVWEDHGIYSVTREMGPS